MRVVGHTIDGNWFVVSFADDAAHIFFEFVAELFPDEALAAFHGKNKMNIELGIGVGHWFDR